MKREKNIGLNRVFINSPFAFFFSLILAIAFFDQPSFSQVLPDAGNNIRSLTGGKDVRIVFVRWQRSETQ